MKKILIMSLMIILGVNIFTGKLQAQGVGDFFAVIKSSVEAAVNESISLSMFDAKYLSEPKTDDVKKVKSDLKEKKAAFKAIKYNSRASRNFNRNFRNVGEPGWATQADAITATFYKNNSKTTVIYDDRGRWVRSLTYMPPNEAPDFVKEQISWVWPDYTMTSAAKIEEARIKYYVVSLENNLMVRWIAVDSDWSEVIKVIKK